MAASLLDRLRYDSTWEEFLQYRTDQEQGSVSAELKDLYAMSRDSECRAVADGVADGTYRFPLPTKKMVAKSGNIRKLRTVYSYSHREMVVLKVLAYLLHKYNGSFAPNLYSFRSQVSVATAIRRMSRMNPETKYGYKADVSNYFNSIPVELILPRLETFLSDDPRLFELFRDILDDNRADYNGDIVVEPRGIMAGLPTSAFLANFYLMEMDWMFHDAGVIYSRYSDDILVLADSEEELLQHRRTIADYLDSVGLRMNERKELTFAPGEPFEFLGFTFDNGVIDISAHSVKKMKGKIRRKCRAYRRWMLKNDVLMENGIGGLIRRFNTKFFGYVDGDLSWSRWFFPCINTDRSLRVIDQYLQEQLRYVATGRHSKKGHEVLPYSLMKELGYRSLVHEYHRAIESHNGSGGGSS